MAVIELVITPVAGKGRALRIGEEAAALNAESNVSIGLGLEEPVELSYLSYRIGSQILGGLHLFLGKSELHL